jgi:hypothetical protein
MKIFKENVYDELSNTVLIIDERIFSHCKIFALQQLRKKAMEKILEVAPEYKQRNAALGLLTEQETDDIKSAIQTIRTQSNAKEAEIAAIDWDGTEETRADKCDQVLAITIV